MPLPFPQKGSILLVHADSLPVLQEDTNSRVA